MKRLTLSHRLLIGSGLLFAGFVVCQLSYAAIGQRIEPDGTSVLFDSHQCVASLEQQRQLGRSGRGPVEARPLAVLSQQVVQLTGKGHREPGRHS
ncbi:MAG: hypothetical protein RLZZ516_2811 [Cyanobacteriota bacterium]